jgi:hypothetical protein
MREKVRDVVDEPVTLEYFQKRWAEGWRVSAVEWQREATGQAAAPESQSDAATKKSGESAEIPYGLRISADCLRLEANPDEMMVMMVILQEIVKETPFSFIAVALNRQRLRTRAGREWTSADVFELMPRLIDAGPHLLKSSEWPARRLEVLRQRVF